MSIISGKVFFLICGLGILFLDHFSLGYCECHESAFIYQCPCEECDDCVTYLTFDLEDFAMQSGVALLIPEGISILDSPPPSLEVPEIVPVGHTSNWNRSTGPPGKPIPLRYLYSVFLI